MTNKTGNFLSNTLYKVIFELTKAENMFIHFHIAYRNVHINIFLKNFSLKFW